ncbi:hypothetical protein BDB00DRAFT_941702 [Zychaea mexicana]|uniref:uncharacterized protein n=1 Tax=Zychaea mexicana TaxID=64656 RepID=UPI0022FF0C00|nr:uncharacterized protein BDB00DRAFT_941702 [Zychaea mexicana]KAI9489280.1 hypothetical protein BDB00DRAFT_941702 [Zychaea mexicana]
MLINELARDLAAHEDPAIKLPCYRIVQRVDPSMVENGAIGCRRVFPIQYSSLRNEQNLKVLLGVESITWLGNTRDRRLAVQINIQNQGNSLHQCFYAFRRTSVDEDSCALWTFDLAEEFDGDPSSDPTSAIEILVGFAHASSATTSCSSSVQQHHDKAEFFETATSFKVLPLTQVSEGWVGLEIQQTVYNDSKHHLMHWGYEIIQRVFDSLNSDGIVDIHSDTASVNTIPQSPGLSPTTATTTEQEPLTPTTTTSTRHSNMFPHYARVHRPTVDHLVVKDDGPNAYFNNKDNDDQQHRLPSYLSRIWNLVFVEQQHAKHNVSQLLADPSMAEKQHPFSATFARLLQSRATCFQQNNQDDHPAILRSTTVVQSRELHRHQPSGQQQQQQQQDQVIVDDEEEEEENDGRRSSYGSLSDLEGNYYSSDPYNLNSADEDEEEEVERGGEQLDNDACDEDRLVDMSTDEEDHDQRYHHPEYDDANDDKKELELDTQEEELYEDQQKYTEQQQHSGRENGEGQYLQDNEVEQQNQAEIEGMINTQQASDIQEDAAMEFHQQHQQVSADEEEEEEEDDNITVKESNDSKPVQPEHDDTVAPAIDEAQSVKDTPDANQEMIDDELDAVIEGLSSPSPQQPLNTASEPYFYEAKDEVAVTQEEQETGAVAAREDGTDEQFSDAPAQETDITTPTEKEEEEEETPTPPSTAAEDKEELEVAEEEQQPMSNSKKKRKAKKAKKRA